VLWEAASQTKMLAESQTVWPPKILGWLRYWLGLFVCSVILLRTTQTSSL